MTTIIVSGIEYSPSIKGIKIENPEFENKVSFTFTNPEPFVVSMIVVYFTKYNFGFKDGVKTVKDKVVTFKIMVLQKSTCKGCTNGTYGPKCSCIVDQPLSKIMQEIKEEEKKSIIKVPDEPEVYEKRLMVYHIPLERLLELTDDNLFMKFDPAKITDFLCERDFICSRMFGYDRF